MPIIDTLKTILDDVLNLQGIALEFSENTKLAGSIPQLDSMAVVALITAIEEELGIALAEEQLDGSVFETLGTLLRFVESSAKLKRT